MRLDLLVATFRRPQLLADLLRSLFAAERPSGLQVRIIIVNNDAESDLAHLASLIAAAPFPVLLLAEPRRGKSRALNLGLRAANADFIGLLDDDERVAPTWFQVAHAALAPGHLDFIGGPMRPAWHSPPPDWIPAGYPAVLGIVDSGPHRVRYTRDLPAMLVGGNAIIRRTMLESIGRFAPELGPQEAHRLMSCEDEDVYIRLLNAGAVGEYLPTLVIYHHVHRDRVRRSYYRAWCFWNGASKAVLYRRRAAEVRTIVGVPRYVFGRAFRGVGMWLKACVTNRGAAARLEAELPLWELAGQLYGRYRFRQLRLASMPSCDGVQDPLASPNHQ